MKNTKVSLRGKEGRIWEWSLLTIMRGICGASLEEGADHQAS